LSVIWNRLIECQDEILNIFDSRATEVQEPGLAHFNQPENGWINRVWANDSVRRAHIDVVDARESRGLWMMHVCCFPNLNNDAPIYGFDVISGKNKMTGAFHDFIPSKQRQLPEWATNIFTDKMLAAGNVKTEEESVAIIDIAIANLNAWFDEVPLSDGAGNRDIVMASQNYYCHNQQQNPHTPNVMKTLGLAEEDVDKFCTDMLFPKIV
jgi:hypothetical protein